MVTHDQSEALSISDRVVVMERGRITQIDQPYRMYEHPRSRFISDFVGKANLLDGVVAQAGAVARGRRSAPRTLEVPGDGLPAGARVLLCLRPEKLALGAPGTGRLPGTVSRRYFLGSQWLYHLDSPARRAAGARRRTSAASRWPRARRPASTGRRRWSGCCATPRPRRPPDERRDGRGAPGPGGDGAARDDPVRRAGADAAGADPDPVLPRLRPRHRRAGCAGPSAST